MLNIMTNKRELIELYVTRNEHSESFLESVLERLGDDLVLHPSKTHEVTLADGYKVVVEPS